MSEESRRVLDVRFAPLDAVLPSSWDEALPDTWPNVPRFGREQAMILDYQEDGERIRAVVPWIAYHDDINGIPVYWFRSPPAPPVST